MKKTFGKSAGSFYFINIFIAIALLTKILYFQYETGLNHGFIFSRKNMSMLVCSLLFIVILAALSNLIFNGKNALLAFYILELLFSILMLSDVNSMRYYYKPLSMFLIYNIDFKFFKAVSNALNSIYKPADIIFIIDLLFVLIAIAFMKKNSMNVSRHFKRATAIVLVSSIILLFSTANASSHSKEIYPDSVNFTARSSGVLPSHIEDLYTFVTKKLLSNNKMSKEEKLALNTYIKYRSSQKTGTNLHGVCSGKNLIYLQVEALQNFVIGLKVNGKEVTPNLNKLASESYYFKNMYYQVSWGNTSDAEFLTNTSMYPCRSASVYYAYPGNTYPSLPAMLKQDGYYTSSFHPFNPHFWNRDTMHKALGFNRFYSEGDFKMDDFAGWEGNALSDKSFLRQSLDKIDTKEPFYSFFITLSSHFPFTWFKNSDFETGLPSDSLLDNYLKAVNYTDSCIGQFIKDLEERGLLENTLLVVYGDHSAIPKYKSGELVSLLGMEYNDQNWTLLQKIPCMIRLPGKSKGETITSVCGQVDIYPTIANLMGYHPFTLGRDLFNTQEHFVVLQDSSVITDEFMYLATQSRLFDMEDLKEIPLQKHMDEIKSLQYDRKMSDLIIAKNAFKNGLP